MYVTTYYYTNYIGHDVLPAPVVAVLLHVVEFLSSCSHYSYQWIDYSQDKAHTKMLHLVLACPRVVTFVHCLFQLTELVYISQNFHSFVNKISKQCSANVIEMYPIC